MERSSGEGFEGQELVLAAQVGDLHAFDSLAKRFRPAAVTLARQIVPIESAEDVAQDALLAAYKALPMLEDVSRFAAWFAAIVRNRARRIGKGLGKTHLPLDDLIISYAPSIVSGLIEDEERREVRCAVSALPAELREATDLHYLQGWTAAQISELLSLPLTTIKWRLHTARKLLRVRLGALEKYDES